MDFATTGHKTTASGGASARRISATNLLALLTLIALPLIVLLRALGQRLFLYGTDTVAHDYVVLLYGWQELRSGNLPLWCPYLFSGLPLIGSFAFCPFYPSQVLFAILPFNTAFTLQYAVALAVGGVTSWYWARSRGLGFWASLFAGLLFEISGHFFTLCYAGHLQKMMAIAWAPLVLAMAPRWSRPGGAGAMAAVVAGVAFALQLLASHTQIAYATFAGALIIGAGELARHDRRTPFFSQALAFLYSLSVAGLIALGLSALQMFPGLEMAAISNRASGVSFAEAVETSYPPHELWEYVISRFMGDSVIGTSTPYLGFWGERIVSDYLGWGVVILALVALGAINSPGKGPLAGVAAFSVVVGLGHHTPLYRWLYDFLPGFAKFRSPGTFMFLATAAVVQLAAMGVDSLLREARRRSVPIATDAVNVREIVRWRRALTIALIAFIVGGALWLAPQIVIPVLGSGTPNQWQRAVPSLLQRVRESALHLMLTAALLFSFALIGGTRQHPLSPGRSASPWPPKVMLAFVALLAVLALGLPLVKNQHFIQMAPLDPYVRHLHRRNSLVRHLERSSPTPPRIAPANLLDNSGLVSRIGSIAGYHPVFLGRYARLAASLGWRSPLLLRYYAVGRVEASSEVSLPPEHWQRIGGEARGATTWIARERWPYVWPASEVQILTDAQDVLTALSADTGATSSATVSATRTQSTRDSRNSPESPKMMRAWVASRDAHPHLKRLSPEVRALVSSKGVRKSSLRGENTSPLEARPQVRLVAWRPGHLLLLIDTDEPRLVTVAENFAPGWKAWDSSRRLLSVFPINYAQIGFAVDGGRSSIVMHYEPASWRYGAFTSLTTLTALLCLFLSRPIPRAHTDLLMRPRERQAVNAR